MTSSIHCFRFAVTLPRLLDAGSAAAAVPFPLPLRDLRLRLDAAGADMVLGQ